MYRGRPPPRGGGYLPYEDRCPPPYGPHLGPDRPYPRPPFIEERDRPRPPYGHGYHDRGPPPDPYRRSAQRRRYPSPGSGSRRDSGDWDSGPPASERLSPSPARGGIPTSLVITVGNELTGPSGVGPPRNSIPPHDRAYTVGAPHAKPYLPRPSYDGPDDRGPRRRSPSRGRSRPRSRSCSPSKGRSKSRPRSRSCSPDRSRAKSRGRSKSRPRSRSCSPDRSRAKSRGRSKSRPRSRSCSPDRSRAKSRGRSKSRPRSRSSSPHRSRAKSRGRSKSPVDRSRSRSRSRSRGRSSGQRTSRARSISRAQSRGRSVGRLKSRSRSVSTSSTSSSRSSSGGRGDGKKNKKKATNEFKELEMARRRKAMEDMLNMPTKSILKKRLDSETDSPLLLQKSDSPRGGPAENHSTSMSREAEGFLSAMKGIEPNMLASMLGELREDPHDRLRQDSSGLSGILGLLGGAGAQQEERRKKVTDIEDEEKFLYGDEEEPVRARSQAPSDRVTEAALYGDFTLHRAVASPRLLGLAGIGDHTIRGPHQQVDIRYQSRSSVTPDQNIKVILPNSGYPLQTVPQEDKDMDEYEKIQDLLKTIGLDLGVTEISKMAARTQERLHGKRAPSKTASRRPEKRERRNSSGSSDGSSNKQRSHSLSHSGSRSSDSSRSHSHSHSRSRSSSLEHRRNQKRSPPPDRRSTCGKSRGGREVKTENISRGIPVLGKTASQTPDPKVMASHSALSMPPYPQTHGLVPPNYPPPGYGQYGNYMPYMAQQWPMYPPPSMGMPPQSPMEDFQNAQTFDRSYGSSKMAPQDHVMESSKAGHQERRVLEEKNNESQKQKVLEERENLRGDRDIRMKKKEYLMKELERLRKQQGELLRKKRREKDGHKDPLLSEISRLQEEVMAQISVLRKEHEAAEKKRSELDKVALILGLCATDKPRRECTASGELVQPSPLEQEKKQEQARSPGKSSVDQSSTAKAAALSSRASPEKSKQDVPASTSSPVIPDLFEYYDAGNHWCKNCNVTSGSMFDFFTHLHSKSHRKTQDPYNRPWAPSITKSQKNYLTTEKMVKPTKGSEFLLPVRGFYCQLCEEFYGDAICAEDHVTTHTHNEKYKKQMYECPLYEKRRNLDRQAALTLEVSDKKHTELKRKHEEEHKNSTEKEGKPKHSKKEKKDKEKDEKSKNKKEEEKPKYSKTEEEESLVYSKRNEEERHKYNKREEVDRYKHSKDEEERPKHSKREEEDKHKYSKEEERYTNRKEEEEEKSRYSRVEDRSKNSCRDDDEEDEEKSRYSKGKEPKSKYSRKEEERYRSEKEEGKFKKEDRQSKKVKAGRPREDEKSGSRKQPEPPEKYVEPPRVFSGPSPAMRAKMRKKSEETGKGGVIAPSMFGKFSWKKKENDLAKEAERVAAEFLRDDETVIKGDGNEDSFSKSLAAAKNIAIKLSGKTVIPQTKTWLPYHSDRGKIRPNLPAPTMVLRKSPWVYAKPAPLNAFLSITPTVGAGVTPLPVLQHHPKKDSSLPANIISKAFGGQEVVLKKPQDQDTGKSDTTSTSVSVNPGSSPTPATATFTEATAQQSKLTMSVMTRNESDVAAPGVPESEQNLTMLVHPPPFMSKPPSEVIQKSEKPKSNLAAAKAQDLFDIFYCNSTPSNTSTATKPAMDPKPGASDSLNCETLESLAPQTKQPLINPVPENTNSVETNTRESEKSENRVEPQPKEDNPETATETLDNPPDKLSISTKTLDLPTEVLNLDLFDFNFE